MQKRTIFVIIFFLLSCIVYYGYCISDPVFHEGGSKFSLPQPRDIEINGINFTVSWGFIEDENSSSLKYDDTILNRKATVEERTLHQNDFLLLDIQVYDFGNDSISFDDLNGLNDGSYEVKSINCVDGIFKNESVETSVGFVKNTHPRYYFDYVKDGKLVMIQCDKMYTIEEIVS